MKKTNHILLGMAVVMATFGVTHAGEIGNGGDAVLCTMPDGQKIATLYDFYEASKMPAFQEDLQKDAYGRDVFVPQFKGSTYQEKVANFISDLALRDPVRAKFWKERAELFEKKRTAVKNATIQDIQDEGFKLNSSVAGCVPRQAVIWRRDEDLRTYDQSKYWYDDEVWAAMDENNRAGSALHEIAWEDSKIHYGHQDSKDARYFLQVMSSKKRERLDVLGYAKLLRESLLSAAVPADQSKAILSTKVFFNGSWNELIYSQFGNGNSISRTLTVGLSLQQPMQLNVGLRSPQVFKINAQSRLSLNENGQILSVRLEDETGNLNDLITAEFGKLHGVSSVDLGYSLDSSSGQNVPFLTYASFAPQLVRIPAFGEVTIYRLRFDEDESVTEATVSSPLNGSKTGYFSFTKSPHLNVDLDLSYGGLYYSQPTLYFEKSKLTKIKDVRVISKQGLRFRADTCRFLDGQIRSCESITERSEFEILQPSKRGVKEKTSQYQSSGFSLGRVCLNQWGAIETAEIRTIYGLTTETRAKYRGVQLTIPSYGRVPVRLDAEGKISQVLEKYSCLDERWDG